MKKQVNREGSSCDRDGCPSPDSVRPHCRIWDDKERHSRHLDTLQSIAAILAHGDGDRAMLAAMLEAIEDHLGLTHAVVFLATPDGKQLTVEAMARSSHEQRPSESVIIERGEGIVGRVLESGTSFSATSLDRVSFFTDRLYRRRSAAKANDLGYACVPLQLGGEVLGTLSVDIPDPAPRRVEEISQLLEIIAGLVAHDIDARHRHRLERNLLTQENAKLRQKLGEKFRPDAIIGNSKKMKALYTRIHQAAPTDTTVLIIGESGTGKELVASSIHYASERQAQPIIRVNCAAYNEQLLESELFGHVKGAFTGAITQRRGLIEEANGGTLFLDEIGEFSLGVQAKLLRVLQEREYTPVGANKPKHADVRFIAATNRDLSTMVDEGKFRLDLFYRLNVFPMHLPALRDRREDILVLAEHFAQQHGDHMGKRIERISTPAINTLLAYHWPGNVRELENCIEHAVLLTEDGVLNAASLPPSLAMPEALPKGTLKARTMALEHDCIVDALKRHEGKVTAVAEELGLTERMIRYKLKQLGIDRKHVVAASKG